MTISKERVLKNFSFWVLVLLIPLALLPYSGARNSNASAQTQPRTRNIQFIKAASGPARPFSPAVRANGFLLLSGQIGTDASGKIVSGGIVPETRQAMENIKKVLADNGSSMDRVVKCTVFIGDMAEWATMNDVYTTFFKEDRRPARSAMGANGLALGAKLEIECLAAE
ncbi:MAG: RidA family protein [Gemmatimonadaceae bacterium]